MPYSIRKKSHELFSKQTNSFIFLNRHRNYSKLKRYIIKIITFLISYFLISRKTLISFFHVKIIGHQFLYFFSSPKVKLINKKVPFFLRPAILNTSGCRVYKYNCSKENPNNSWTMLSHHYSYYRGPANSIKKPQRIHTISLIKEEKKKGR